MLHNCFLNTGSVGLACLQRLLATETPGSLVHFGSHCVRLYHVGLHCQVGTILRLMGSLSDFIVQLSKCYVATAVLSKLHGVYILVNVNLP